MTNPALSEETQAMLRRDLMAGWRAKRKAQLADDLFSIRIAKIDIDCTKQMLGERGPVWWDDGAPDYNRYLAKNTPYKSWEQSLS